MTEDELNALQVEAQACFRSGFAGMITILCLDESKDRKRVNATIGGILMVDGYQTPPKISTQLGPPVPSAISTNEGGKDHCLWRASRQILRRIFDGDRQLTGAFVSGRLAIAGDMAVMARLVLTDKHTTITTAKS